MNKLYASVLATLCICLFTISCNKDEPVIPPVTEENSFGPKGTKPLWGPTIDDSMLVSIEALQSLGGSPIEALTPMQARMQPTLRDAVQHVMAEYAIPAPVPQVDTMGVSIPVTGGTIHARVYTPHSGSAPFPVIAYYHGGGWVIADINVYDASARALAEQTNAVVVSVEYRKGPEFKFPTAHNDSFQAYQWILQNAGMLNINPAKIAVAGESAGGNLACNVSIMARDNGVTIPLHQVLVYPVTDNDINSDSYLRYAQAKPLNRAMVSWFLSHFLNDMSESSDPRMKLVSANLSGLPPTTIINAEIDVLHDDGLKLQNALQSAGVTVTRAVYPGVTHEFFGAATVINEAKSAQALASNALKAAFQ